MIWLQNLHNFYTLFYYTVIYVCVCIYTHVCILHACFIYNAHIIMCIPVWAPYMFGLCPSLTVTHSVAQCLEQNWCSNVLSNEKIKTKRCHLCLGLTLRTQKLSVLGNRLQTNPTVQTWTNSHTAGFLPIEVIQYRRITLLLSWLSYFWNGKLAFAWKVLLCRKNQPLWKLEA